MSRRFRFDRPVNNPEQWVTSRRQERAARPLGSGIAAGPVRHLDPATVTATPPRAKPKWWRAEKVVHDSDGTWSISHVAKPSTPQSEMFEEIRREREKQREYRGRVTWKYNGPDLGPNHPYVNQVRPPNE